MGSKSNGLGGAMRDWAWLLKWGWIASGLLALAFLFSTWHSAGASKEDDRPPVRDSSGPGVDLPPSDTVPIAAIKSLHRDAVQVSPYQLVFTYGFLPITLGGQPSPDEAGFYYVQIGDVTGDGKNDLVSLGYVSEPSELLHVYPQLPNGLLGPSERYAVPSVIGLALADMNNDGTADVVMTNIQGVTLALSDGRGKLRVVPFSTTVADKKEMDVPAVAADFDRDGNIDVLTHLSVTHADKGDMNSDRRSRFRLFYGDGVGGIRRSMDFAIFGVDTHDYGAYDTERATSLAVDDLNGDGYPDIAMASRRFIFVEQGAPRFISIYTNDQTGGFVETDLINAFVKTPNSTIVLQRIAIGDFNSDGRQDLAASPIMNVTYTYWFLQLASGAFPDMPDYKRRSGQIVESMVGFDLNADRKDDLLLGNSGWGQIVYHLQNDGVLGEETNVPLSGFAGYDVLARINPTGLAVGDLNSDGCPDVAVAADYNGLQVFMGLNCTRRHNTGGRLPAQRL